jgi:WD40 repeat protein
MEDKAKNIINPLEIARILGEPRVPEKTVPEIVASLCELDTADPDEYVYYYDVLADTDICYDITATGSVTSQNVTPDTPALFNFTDVSTPEYYVKITDLAKAKETVLARKTALIERSLNLYETFYLMTVMDPAVRAGNTEGLRSSASHFSYENLIEMIDDVKDYSDNYTLVAGGTIDKDIMLWDWRDNKYANLAEALKALGIDVIRLKVPPVTINSVVQTVLSSTVAYLVGKNTVMGKPFLFVRKRLNDIDFLGGVLKQNGEKPERLIFVSPNPIVASGGSTRYLAVGITGFEEIVVACTNPYAIAKFNRA